MTAADRFAHLPDLLAADTDLLEFVCLENERDQGHLNGGTR